MIRKTEGCVTSEKFVASNSKLFVTVPHGDNNMSRKKKLFCSEATNLLFSLSKKSDKLDS
jgi:hypothetical protein